MIVEGHRAMRRRENDTPRDKILGRCSWEIFLVWSAFCDCYVSRRFGELGELRVGDIRLVHVEAVHVDAVNGTRIKGGFHAHIVHIGRVICSHGKFAAWNPDHPLGSRSKCSFVILNGWLKWISRSGGTRRFHVRRLRIEPEASINVRRKLQVREACTADDEDEE